MKEPKIIQIKDMKKNVTYYEWPDGTLREVTYNDFTEKNMSGFRVTYERLRFIVHRTVELVRHFKSIEIRKKSDRVGHRYYTARIKYDEYFNGKGVPVGIRNISLRRTVINGSLDVESSAKSR